MKRFYRSAPVILGATLLTMLIWVPTPAHANTFNGYILNTLAGDVPAKHTLTQREDIEIANHCADGGGKKDACLCVVKVLKYDLNIRDYRKIAARVRPDEDAPRPLPKDRYSQTVPTKPLDPIIRTLLTTPDISQRCEIADLFYSQQTPAR
ncbi:MAG: hypothetical protein ACSHX3_16765 [Litorimonas sp.]